uniref:Uncharacterized protein n=1 Tax=Ditylenchus dipsaci TaxID=166011 RepID=A0A915DC39_9BILA
MEFYLSSPEKALEDAIRALEVDAKDPKANFVKALSLIHMQKCEEAIPHLEKCLKFDPKHVEALYHLKLTKERIENKENLGEKHLIKDLSSATETLDDKQRIKGQEGTRAEKICSAESEDSRRDPVKKEAEFVFENSVEEIAAQMILYTLKKPEAPIDYLPSPGKYLVKEMAELKIDEEKITSLSVSAAAEDLQAGIVEVNSSFPLQLADEDTVHMLVDEAGTVESADAKVPLECTNSADSNIHLPSPEKKSDMCSAREVFRDTSLLLDNLDAEIEKYSLKSPRKSLVKKAAETITKFDKVSLPQESPSENTAMDIKPENLNKKLVVESKISITPAEVSKNPIVASNECKSKISEEEKPAGKSKFSLSALSQTKKSNSHKVAPATKALGNETLTGALSTVGDVNFSHFTAASGPQFSLLDSGGNLVGLNSWKDVVCLLKMCRQPIGRIVLQDISLDKQALEFFRSLDAACFNGVEICFNGIDFSTFGGIKGLNSVLLCKALNSYPGLQLRGECLV